MSTSVFKTCRFSAVILAGTMSLSLLSGCSYLAPYKAPLTQGNVMTDESIGLLQEGLTQSQVRELLGPPMGQNPFKPLHWEYIYYSTITHIHAKTHERHLIIEFDKDKLVSSWRENKNNIALKKDSSWLGLGWF